MPSVRGVGAASPCEWLIAPPQRGSALCSQDPQDSGTIAVSNPHAHVALEKQQGIVACALLVFEKCDVGFCLGIQGRGQRVLRALIPRLQRLLRSLKCNFQLAREASSTRGRCLVRGFGLGSQ